MKRSFLVAENLVAKCARVNRRTGKIHSTFLLSCAALDRAGAAGSGGRPAGACVSRYLAEMFTCRCVLRDDLGVSCLLSRLLLSCFQTRLRFSPMGSCACLSTARLVALVMPFFHWHCVYRIPSINLVAVVDVLDQSPSSVRVARSCCASTAPSFARRWVPDNQSPEE